MANDDAEAKEQVDIVRYREVSRVLRWFFVCALIAFCIWRIEPLLDKMANRPPWLAIILALVAPGGVILLLLRYVHAWIRRNLRRMKVLEEQADPERESSGLEMDGRNPVEDQI